MKKFNIFGTALLLLFVGQGSFADNGPTPPPAPENRFEVNPTSLRQRLLDANLSIVTEYNQLNLSKDKVSSARASLLPGVSINATAFTSFGISEIQYLLPFLIPSNWFNYFSSKHQLDAEKISFYIVELNTYSSALGYYFSAIADSQAAPFYQKEADDFQSIANNYAALLDKGLASEQDASNAQITADIYATAASNSRILVADEKAAIRSMLNIADPHTDIVIDPFDLPQSDLEGKDIADLEKQANALAPEHAQVKALVLAGKMNEWGTIFSFITGSQFSGSSNNPGGLSSLAGGVGITLTPNLIPNIKISKDNITIVQSQDEILTNSTDQTVETALAGLTESKLQLQRASDGETRASQLYFRDQVLYDKGLCGFSDLMNASIALSVATLQRIQAEQNINLARLTFERIFLTDQFAPIKPCNMSKAPKKKTGARLDQLCRQGGSSN